MHMFNNNFPDGLLVTSLHLLTVYSRVGEKKKLTYEQTSPIIEFLHLMILNLVALLWIMSNNLFSTSTYV